LTRVFGALALDPGTGPEASLEKRKEVLDTLVGQSHILANALAEAVMGDDKTKVPRFLRARLLQQSAEFVSEQWKRHGAIDTKDMVQIAKAVFGAELNNINQEVVELFHDAEEYTPATTQELSQAKITVSATCASWHILRQVQQFDLRQFDPDLDTSGSPSVPFSWGKDAYAVARNLTKIALSIVKENALDLDDLDMATTWTQNSITRASMLVQAEYRMITERALRSSFKDAMLSEARMGQLSGMYDDMLIRVAKRARQGYITVERNAVDVMAATAFTSYLPKISQPDSTKTETQTQMRNTVRPFKFQAVR